MTKTVASKGKSRLTKSNNRISRETYDKDAIHEFYVNSPMPISPTKLEEIFNGSKAAFYRMLKDGKWEEERQKNIRKLRQQLISESTEERIMASIWIESRRNRATLCNDMIKNAMLELKLHKAKNPGMPIDADKLIKISQYVKNADVILNTLFGDSPQDADHKVNINISFDESISKNDEGEVVGEVQID